MDRLGKTVFSVMKENAIISPRGLCFYVCDVFFDFFFISLVIAKVFHLLMFNKRLY